MQVEASDKDIKIESNDNGEVMAARRRQNSVTTPDSSPPSRTLLPPFRGGKQTHLPTPQSPGNINTYANSLSFLTDSPVRHGSQRMGLPGPNPNRTPMLEPMSPPSGSLLTPESSPLFTRTIRSANGSFVHSPPTTPRQSAQTGREDTFATPIDQSAPSHPSTSSHVRASSPHSVLSSPFVDRRTPAQSTSSRRSHSNSPVHPMDVDEVFSRASSSSRITTSLQAPIPQRPVGGEIQRIRLQMAADQAAKQLEAESRRPEYLKRNKRPIAEFDLDMDGFDSIDKDMDVPANLGVLESPVKGRRITLFQETSEESFEQSLLAGGYPRYGDTPAYASDLQLPQIRGKEGLSQQAIEWLHHATPGQPNPTVRKSQEPEPDWVPSEKEIKKRKRLAAFEDRVNTERPKLFPVEIKGRGRILLDQPVEEIPSLNETPNSKKRGNRRRKGIRGGAAAGTNVRRRGQAVELPPVQEDQPAKPNWLDSEFPWSVRCQERAASSRLEHEERMKWIERFLDRDSDEEEDEEDQSLGLPAVEELDPPLFKRGRGKMVPLKADPDAKPKDYAGRVLVPSDPADARAALLSKRSVRALAFRHQQEKLQRSNVDDEILDVVCICNGRDDGRELVQCDECHTWYHLECIGIRSISDLGREEDPWYCHNCLEPEPTPELSSEPTLVPTDDEPIRRQNRGTDTLFLSGPLQQSPLGVPWGTPRIPKTPVRTRTYTEGISTRSSFGESSSSQIGPTTPNSSARGVRRVYGTPTIFDNINSDDFDPTSTPSRGIRMTNAFATPRTTNLWSTRDGLVQTPTHQRSGGLWKHSGGAIPFMFDESGGGLARGSASVPYRPLYSLEDTPVRRSKPRDERAPNTAPSRRYQIHLLRGCKVQGLEKGTLRNPHLDLEPC
ncbi:hypothetical protein ABKN59_003237 [Abortiporus biennis]